MYYYEFTIIYKDGKVSCPSVEPQELNDQIAYCREGVRAGWLKSYDYKRIDDV